MVSHTNYPTWIPAATASSCEAALSAEEMKAAAKQSPAPDTHTTPPRITNDNKYISCMHENIFKYIM